MKSVMGNLAMLAAYSCAGVVMLMAVVLPLAVRVFLQFMPTLEETRRRGRAAGDGDDADRGGAFGAEMADPWAVLGVVRPEGGEDADATRAALKRAHRKLALRYHPDKNKDNMEHANLEMAKINAAYDRCLLIIDGVDPDAPVHPSHEDEHQPFARPRRNSEQEEQDEQDDAASTASTSGQHPDARRKSRKGKRRASATDEVEREREEKEARRVMRELHRERSAAASRARRLRSYGARSNESVRQKAEEMAKKGSSAWHTEITARESASSASSVPSPPNGSATGDGGDGARRGDKGSPQADFVRRLVMENSEHSVACAIRIDEFGLLVGLLSYAHNPFEAIDEEGNTAMHYCAYFNRGNFASAMISLAGNEYWRLVLARNANGETPLDVCRTSRVDADFLERMEAMEEPAQEKKKGSVRTLDLALLAVNILLVILMVCVYRWYHGWGFLVALGLSTMGMLNTPDATSPSPLRSWRISMITFELDAAAIAGVRAAAFGDNATVFLAILAPVAIVCLLATAAVQGQRVANRRTTAVEVFIESALGMLSLCDAVATRAAVVVSEPLNGALALLASIASHVSNTGGDASLMRRAVNAIPRRFQSPVGRAGHFIAWTAYVRIARACVVPLIKQLGWVVGVLVCGSVGACVSFMFIFVRCMLLERSAGESIVVSAKSSQ